MARRVGESLDTAYDLAVETQDGQFPRLAEEELDFLIKYFQGVHADALMHQSPRKWWEEGTS